MSDNQINDSGQVNSGRRWDYRDNPWDSVADALVGITGSQRVEGHLIPVRLPNGLVFPHHFIEGQLVPFEGRINQPDQLLFSGFSFVDAGRTAGKIEGSEWRVSDYKWTLQTPVTYPIDPVGAGLFRTDYIVGDPFGKTFYLKGEEGGTYVPPSLPYKHIIIQEIQVSDSAATNVEPEIPSPDGEPLYGPAAPLDSQGKAGDSYTVTEGADKGKEYKKKTVGGVTSWVLEYTPDTGGASSFADLSGAPEDNPLLEAALEAKASISHTHTSSAITDFTEAVQDAVAGLLGAGSNITLTYNDAANTFTIDATAGSSFDPEAVRDAIGAAIVGVGNIAVTINDAGDTITISTTATANSTDAALRDRSTHTGMQAQSTITDLVTDLAGKEPVITGTTAADFWSGAKTFLNFATTLFASVLPALSAGVNTPIVAGISIKAALENLQAQITALSSAGGATKPIQVFNEVLTTAGWTLISGYYVYTYTNANITVKSIVDFTPVNASVETVKSAEILPLTVSAAGSCKLYSVYLPLANITVNVTITESL